MSLSRLSSLGLAGWSPSRLPRPAHEDNGDGDGKEDVKMNDSGHRDERRGSQRRLNQSGTWGGSNIF